MPGLLRYPVATKVITVRLVSLIFQRPYQWHLVSVVHDTLPPNHEGC